MEKLPDGFSDNYLEISMSNYLSDNPSDINVSTGPDEYIEKIYFLLIQKCIILILTTIPREYIMLEIGPNLKELLTGIFAGIGILIYIYIIFTSIGRQ